MASEESSSAAPSAVQSASLVATNETESDATVQPLIWGSVIKVLTSKPACISARDFYNNTFPDLPKVKCLKMGKVWVVVPR
ncbi:hypothetical protein [Microbacterium sp. G2-8]|uniref:hypothetical protein n=1 Tax=Microbacterium sp. G2-8 TaxID=2842454 RepID=UPI001C8988AF|nr:hypothetical protein [Microbacterium sp. G2-8]